MPTKGRMLSASFGVEPPGAPPIMPAAAERSRLIHVNDFVLECA